LIGTTVSPSVRYRTTVGETASTTTVGSSPTSAVATVVSDDTDATGIVVAQPAPVKTSNIGNHRFITRWIRKPRTIVRGR
jgi:hypothetical protein